MLTLGSLFDGIGGWLLAAVHNGVKPIWSSEIEKFPMAVTKHHFPDVIQLGDITKLDGATLPPVDIICAGSPCQDLSVAGKREGLKGERSGLFINAINIVRRMRMSTGGRQPRFFVWENVPGAFSSNKGLDFRAVLEEIGQTEVPMPANGKWAENGVAQLPGCEIAWRVLDAQWWVPQRRKRIFLVADFGPGKPCAKEILFVEKSLRGNYEKGQCPGQEAAGSVTDGTGIPIVLRMRGGCDGGGKGALLSENRSLTLAANTKDQTLFQEKPNVNVVFSMGHDERETQFLKNQANPLTACDYKQPPMVGPVPANDEIYTVASDERSSAFKKNVCDTLTHHDHFRSPVVNAGYAVRRLMPIECERLQGLPDNYTLIDDKSCSDSARYKALGNGMAQPCADFVIRRIKEVTCDT